MIHTLQIGRKPVPTHATFNNWFAQIGQQKEFITLGCVLIALVAATRCQYQEGKHQPEGTWDQAARQKVT